MCIYFLEIHMYMLCSVSPDQITVPNLDSWFKIEKLLSSTWKYVWRDDLILGFESGLKDWFGELVGALLTEVAKMQSTITVDQIWEGPIGCPLEGN